MKHKNRSFTLWLVMQALRLATVAFAVVAFMFLCGFCQFPSSWWLYLGGTAAFGSAGLLAGIISLDVEHRYNYERRHIQR